jgi:hypothetical protein
MNVAGAIGTCSCDPMNDRLEPPAFGGPFAQAANGGMKNLRESVGDLKSGCPGVGQGQITDIQQDSSGSGMFRRSIPFHSAELAWNGGRSRLG